MPLALAAAHLFPTAPARLAHEPDRLRVVFSLAYEPPAHVARRKRLLVADVPWEFADEIGADRMR